MEVQILLCSRVLARIGEVEDESISFLTGWLSERQTIAVVLPQAWKAFVTQLEAEMEGFRESRDAVLGILRGILTPYREKYADEAGIPPDGEVVEGMDEVSAMRTITTRHYATCMYLVTDAPEEFRGKGLRLPDSRILTPDLFRAELEPAG